jgi:hypothetical protein
MIAERATEPVAEGGEVGSGGAEHTVDVTAWLTRRPSLTRAFVDDYRPRHRAEPGVD